MRRLTRSLSLSVVLLAGLASLALAANPLGGATYSGRWGPQSFHATVKFKTSRNGKRVSGFKIAVGPLGCQGAPPTVKSGGSAAVKKGKFRVSLTLYFPPTKPSRHVGKLVVTGAFAGHGKESGKLTDQFNGKSGYSKSCDTTVSYTTRGKR